MVTFWASERTDSLGAPAASTRCPPTSTLPWAAGWGRRAISLTPKPCGSAQDPALLDVTTRATLAFLAEPDELDRMRILAPVGSEVRGTVSYIPEPTGRIGIFVDLGLPAGGFVDVLELPYDPKNWPPVGTILDFEVLQHRVGQVRLYPLDPKYRKYPKDDGRKRYTRERWGELKRRYPVGSVVSARVTEVFPSNRECWVTDGVLSEGVEWTAPEPVISDEAHYLVTGHRDTIQRVLLRRLAEPAQKSEG